MIAARQHVADIKAVDSGWLDDDVEVSVCAVFWPVVGLNGRVLPRLDTPFDVDLFVSGYAYKLTGVGFNTRAGRAFLRLAKSKRLEMMLVCILTSQTF